MPLISVVMPAFNAEKTIAQSIDSVLAQTVSDFELIIVDDMSTDRTSDVMEAYASQDRRIRLTSTGRNSGRPAVPRNLALSQCNSRYVAFLDADDVWLPEKTEIQLAQMRATGAAISCSGFDVINIQGRTIGVYMPPVRADYESLLRVNSIGCLTAIYDVEQTKYPSFPICGHEDYALWLELTRDGTTVYGLQRRLAAYRVGAYSVSSNKVRALSFLWHIYHDREGFSCAQSTFMSLRYAALNGAKYYRKAPIAL